MYCAASCPYPQTASGADCSGTLGTFWEAKFNTFETSTWTSNTIVGTGTNLKPAKNRGIYFNVGSPTAGIELDYDNAEIAKWNIDVTISSWIRLDVLDSLNTIFDKENNAEPPKQTLAFSITSSGNLQLYVANPSDVSQGETKDSSGSIAIQ